MTVIFRMPNACSPTCHLDITPLHRFHIPHRVFVAEFAGNEIREDLCFLVSVTWKSGHRLHEEISFVLMSVSVEVLTG